MKKSVLLPQEWPGVHYMDHQEVEAVTRVLTARSPFRYYGPDLQQETLQFEKNFADFTGAKYCLGVSSGTAALQVALAAMGVGPGDEVVLPGYFWVSTVAAVIRSGAVPVLADVDDSFSLDPDDLQKKINSRTRAVIVVHMGGVIGQIDRIASICQKNNLLLLEDCAQSAGASKFGKPCGTFGDMAIFSFQLNKNCTAGEGGAIVTNNIDFFKKAEAIHDLGYPRDNHGRLILNDESRQYWGIGCRMNELTAAVLNIQLKKLPDIVQAMNRFKYELMDILNDFPRVKPRNVEDPAGDSGGFLKILFENAETARNFKQGLLRNGIKVKENGLYPILMTEWGLHIYHYNNSLVNKQSICGHHSVWDLHENKFARHYSYEKGSLPRLDDFVERTMIFCIASKLDKNDKEGAIQIFQQTCDEVVPNY